MLRLMVSATGHLGVFQEESLAPVVASAWGGGWGGWPLQADPAASPKLLSSQSPRLTKQMAPRSAPRVSGLHPVRALQATILKGPEGHEPGVLVREGGHGVGGLGFLSAGR